MSMILKTAKVQYKDPDSGKYVGINGISDAPAA